MICDLGRNIGFIFRRIGLWFLIEIFYNLGINFYFVLRVMGDMLDLFDFDFFVFVFKKVDIVVLGLLRLFLVRRFYASVIFY